MMMKPANQTLAQLLSKRIVLFFINQQQLYSYKPWVLRVCCTYLLCFCYSLRPLVRPPPRPATAKAARMCKHKP